MQTTKTGEVQIRHYKPRDYEKVREIFSKGIPEALVPTLQSNWNGERPKTLICHLALAVSCFLAAHYICLAFGLLCFSLIFGLYFFSVYTWFFEYVR